MQEPIRILQLFTILNRGGAETNVMNYYRKLDKTKFQFDFAVHREEKGAYEEEIKALGGRIFRFNNIHPLKLKAYKIQIQNFFDQHQYSIIHGQCSELGYFFYKEAYKRGVPVIIAHAHNANPKFDLKLIPRLILKKMMLRYVNVYFSCSDDASHWFFGKKNISKVFTMTNAIQSDLFRYFKELDNSFRDKMNIENSKNIVHIGRFCEQKNHNFLIDVFYYLNKKDVNYKLFLIGDGELKELIKKKVCKMGISEKVFFLGLRDDVNQLLQAMDVFLFPSLFEGLGIAFIEAQSSGVKCVVSDKIPKEAILIPENVSVISLKESAQQWADKIHLLELSAKKDVSTLIQEKGYDIDSNVRILEDKYTALLQGKK